ncbi:mobilisation protein (MobC) [Maridesulfovibrio ferrireducens]|uniref:Mobilisation protein (MobC) n=1 Tax=Maridesulfovibrio ferrireducens TaxID=246191 RepID=A0A1G9KWW2_9BACT|nr:MobC family plasmid mobilization relaxosome protein [Maridesulfovibrio ferrireducens]SDL53947.1 mobilisation protein (MobC) [Maridesulfovibrio ferrireducens]
MSTARTKWINLRVTPEEKKIITSEAETKGMSTCDFVRHKLGKQRVRKTKREREKLLHVARIGNNLNQLARWANTYKSNADSILILAELSAVEKELKCI